MWFLLEFWSFKTKLKIVVIEFVNKCISFLNQFKYTSKISFIGLNNKIPFEKSLEKS